MSLSGWLKSITRKMPLTQATLVYLRDYRPRPMRVRNSNFREANVAMFHTGRSGSTVLANMLNDHSEVNWGGELLGRMNERYRFMMRKPDAPQSIIERSCYSRLSRIYGFETKYLPQQNHRVDMDLEDYISLLRRLHFTKFIVLHRNNYLRQIVSLQVARESKELHVGREAKVPTKVEINVDAFLVGNVQMPLLELLNSLDSNYARLKAIFTKDEALLLSYEDDVLGDPRIAYRKMCGFLGIEDEGPEVRLRRTNPFPVVDMISNIDQVASVLKPTKYSWMLNDDSRS
jgi:hypothetical protein